MDLILSLASALHRESDLRSSEAIAAGARYSDDETVTVGVTVALGIPMVCGGEKYCDGESKGLGLGLVGRAPEKAKPIT
ncbi:hypothetical protein E3N88_21090 [Mikania micrantha]|uniref:Uncharacterized protein n=1 Tax=Mikania micrantha TaxID=192012 RepID=A0A5N6NLJ2_9ASTR|nr:hypothetical protein E3N88_21090 [Mikania micrantha]